MATLKRLVCVCLATVIVMVSESINATESSRTNFVIVLCDDLGCFGHPRIQTLQLDKLAGEGPETLNRDKGSERSHGRADPLRGVKRHMYEGGIRVPGILARPVFIASHVEQSGGRHRLGLGETKAGRASVPIRQDTNRHTRNETHT